MIEKHINPAPINRGNELSSSPENNSVLTKTTPMKKKNTGAIKMFLGADSYALPAFSFIIIIEETWSSWLPLHANPWPKSVKQSLHKPFPQHLHRPTAEIFS
jgi:hypothetical protein